MSLCRYGKGAEYGCTSHTVFSVSITRAGQTAATRRFMLRKVSEVDDSGVQPEGIRLAMYLVCVLRLW